MKKLNRKGFTLIELLAVVVILAVILVVTIPSVLTSMDTAKTQQLKNAANSVQEWEQKQYEIATYGSGLATPDTHYVTPTSSGADIKGNLKYMGMADTTGVTAATAKLTDGKVCISITTNSSSKFGAQTVTSSNC